MTMLFAILLMVGFVLYFDGFFIASTHLGFVPFPVTFKGIVPWKYCLKTAPVNGKIITGIDFGDGKKSPPIEGCFVFSIVHTYTSVDTFTANFETQEYVNEKLVRSDTISSARIMSNE